MMWWTGDGDVLGLEVKTASNRNDNYSFDCSYHTGGIFVRRTRKND